MNVAKNKMLANKIQFTVNLCIFSESLITILYLFTMSQFYHNSIYSTSPYFQMKSCC